MIRATTLRMLSCSGVRLRGRPVVAGTTTEGWQDKRAHGARRAEDLRGSSQQQHADAEGWACVVRGMSGGSL